jgi:hypothetical protein
MAQTRQRWTLLRDVIAVANSQARAPRRPTGSRRKVGAWAVSSHPNPLFSTPSFAYHSVACRSRLSQLAVWT